jgi:hypothetical protein
MAKIEEKMKIYFCTKCGAHVEDDAIKCTKCRALLSVDGGVKTKIVTVKKYREMEDAEHPSFKLDKWYKLLFFYIGWIGVLNLVYWLSMLIVYYKNLSRYDRFINPATEKTVFIWGIIYSCFFVFSIILGLL